MSVAHKVTRASGHALNNALTALLNYAPAETRAGARSRVAAERAAAVTHRMLLLVPGAVSPPAPMDLNQAVVDAAATAKMIDARRPWALQLHPAPVAVVASWAELATALLDTLLDAEGPRHVAVSADGSVAAGGRLWRFDPDSSAVREPAGDAGESMPGAPVPSLLMGDGATVRVTGEHSAVALAERVLRAAGYSVDQTAQASVELSEPTASVDVLLAARRALAGGGSNR